MTLTSPPIAVAPFDKGKLAAGITASATTITVSPIYKTISGVRTKQGFNTTSGIALISQGDFTERISFEGSSVDATTKITTLTTCVRGLSQTSTTANFTGGTGKDWRKGAKIAVIADASYFQSGVYTNVANTFSAKQTFSAGADFTGVTRPPKFPSYTSTERDALTPEVGFKIFNTTTGTEQTYYGGQWNDAGTSTVANGSTTVAGKYEEATVAEQGTATATGATGARLVPAVANLVATSAGSGDASKIPILDASGLLATSFLPAVPVTKGGTGLATLTSNNLMVGAGTSNVTFIAPGIAGTTLVSGGTTATFKAPPALASTSADSTATTSNTSENIIDQKYPIPAASVAAGDVFHVIACGTMTSGLGPTLTFRIKMGSTTIDSFSQGTSNNAAWKIDSWITVRATGGSGTVVCNSRHTRAGETAVTETVVSSPVTIDFTAAQDLQISAQGSANASATMTQFIVHKLGL